MDWAGFRFLDPAWLWAGLLGPLVLVVAWLRERDASSRAVSFPGVFRLLRVRPGVKARLRHLPLALAALAFVVGALALARPQHGTLREDVTTQGVDIVVSLDVQTRSERRLSELPSSSVASARSLGDVPRT